MKPAALTLALLAAPALAAAPTPARLPADIRYPKLAEFRIPKPERIELPNGMVLLLLPDRDLPLVQGTALIRTGSRLEPADKVGLAGLVGAVLRTGGTARRSGDAIDDLLEGIGATVETSIGVDQGRASFSCLSPDLDAVLGVLAEMLREPAFAADKLEVAKTQARAAIARRNDNPGGILSREFTKLVYGASSPYARHSEYATIDAIGRDDLVEFHRRHFHAGRTLLGLSGDFEPRAARALVEKHFGSWARGEPAAPFTGGLPDHPAPGLHLVEKTDVNQSSIAIGHLGIRTDDPDYHAVSVMNEVFGGGFSARLFSNVRSKKGLAYSVGGGVFDQYDRPGIFRISMSTKSESTVAGIRALEEELDRMLAAPPGADEVQRAKDSILNSFIFNFDTASEILDRQLTYEYFGYPLDFLDRYRAGIEKVTVEDVHRVAKKHMRPAELVKLVVGRSKDFDQPLSTLAEVRALDVTIPPPARPAVPRADAASLARGRELVARAAAWLGGKDALARLGSLSARATLEVMNPGGAMSLKATMSYALPDRVRQELETPVGRMTMIVAGDAGWGAGPQGVQDMPAAQRVELLAGAHRALVFALADPALEAQWLGADSGADRVLLRTRGQELTLWIAGDGRVLKDAFQGSGPGGAPMAIERSYSDWKPVAGLNLPHRVESTASGKPYQTVRYEELTINPPVDPKLYSRPAAP